MSFEGYWIICRAHDDDHGCTAYSRQIPEATVDGLAKEEVIEQCESRIREHLMKLQDKGREFPPFEKHSTPPETDADVLELKFVIVEDYGHSAREQKKI